MQPCGVVSGIKITCWVIGELWCLAAGESPHSCTMILLQAFRSMIVAVEAVHRSVDSVSTITWRRAICRS